MLCRYNDTRITLEALEIPNICSMSFPPISSELLKKLRIHGLVAADVPPTKANERDEIGVLVGFDNYWKIVSGEIIRVDE